MQAFTKISGVAAPLPMINVDTDMLVPKQYLKTIKRTGLGKILLDELRHDEKGDEIPDFVLNQAPYSDAKILIAGDNFGTGSSREHAPWALLDFGIRSIIAPSFADIFFNNCFKNGILPIRLPQQTVDTLMADAKDPATCEMTVDLESQTITRSNGETIAFDVEPFRRHCLLNGLDDIGLTLQKDADIAAYEAKQRQIMPWLWANEA